MDDASKNGSVRRRRFVDWIVATRPWSFSASVIPIAAVALWLVWRFGHGDWINILLSLAVIVCLHACSNVFSDCRDHERKVDFPGSPNGVSWIQDGRFTVSALRRYASVLLMVGILLGCGVAARCLSWYALGIGVAGVALAVGYSFLKYHALGDLAVFLAFSALPSVGLGVVAVGNLLPETLLVVLPPGLLTMAILNANNIRDVETDARAQCRTLPMLLGCRGAGGVYWIQTFLPYLLVSAFIAFRLVPYAAIATFLTLPLAIRNAMLMRRGELATLDRSSAQLQLIFGVLYAISFPVGLLDFWWQMSIASVVTGGLALKFASRDVCRNVLLEGVLAVVLAAALWGVFWLGNEISRMLFDFSRGQVDAIYALRADQSPVLIGVLLLVLIGPAEELFWRGVVQHRLSQRLGPNFGFVLAAFCYTFIHVWSFNFMLIGAAAVCGVIWGACYRFFPKHLPALVLSHAIWDAVVFVVFPI